MSTELAELQPMPARDMRTADESAFALAIRRAKALTSSSIVPESYRGEANLGNAMIALEVAERTGVAPLQVMQNLHVIHGRPSWSSTFLIATVNACGRFSPLRFETCGDDPDADDYRVRAIAREKDSGDVLEGPWITWKMVKAEGWSKKTGSKWMTMPALMFMYRAAAFWTRLFAPELSLGMHTVDEVEDFATGPSRSQPAERADIVDLGQRLRARAQQTLEHQPVDVAVEPEAAADPEPTGYVCNECLQRSESDEHCTHCGAER